MAGIYFAAVAAAPVHELAERFGLMASCGSDFHRPGDYNGGTLGTCPELPPNCKPVWANFQTA